MPKQYRHHHYVPQWYQKRFFPSNNGTHLYYLDLNPRRFTDSKGVLHSARPVSKLGPSQCFAAKDLYSARFGSKPSLEIEKFFFGDIDQRGAGSVDYFSKFSHPSGNDEAFKNLLIYLTTQKLRTPKGLDWLSSQIKSRDKNQILSQMMQLRQLYSAIWTECVWQIADAAQSDTKFIISDHPVTVYNRRCGPRSQWCRGYNDPDIRFHGTHTIFPLSLDKILIFTNLSWVRNPYQSEILVRPNPNFFRSAMFKYSDIQIMRYLNEDEVCEINFIIKSRAYRFIAAAQEDWLYPERKVSKSNWNRYGHGYLLMPDPRPIHLGGEVIIGYKDGSATSFDEYGRRPWQKGYGKESRTFEEARTLDNFQGEFARIFGPRRRGRSFEHLTLDNEIDSDEFHQYHLDLERSKKKK